jgi:hypothetical protein
MFIKNTYNIIPVIDACTLNGYPGIWYRNRANQIGYQPISSITNLQHILNQLIASSGVTYAYVDGSLYARDISIAYLDSSLNQLFGLIGDTSIKGAVNVGDGSAGVYAGITSDGSIRLRELVGSGNLIVDQIGDLITIHLDASSSNSYSASNIPGGDASIFNQKTPFNDFQFKEIVSLDSSIISITSDSSFVYFEYVASPFDILDGGDSFANTETDIFDANSSVDVLVGGTY